jgi:superfamily II DNA or RNA helicase
LLTRDVTCEEVSAKTPKRKRIDLIDRFRSGELRCVVNVGVLTTGFDFPELDCVILGRPTKSLALYYQMTGRGVRPAPGKSGCDLIDLCDNVRRFGKVETFDLYDQNGRGMWRLKSNAGPLTGVDVTTGQNLEKFRLPPKPLVDPGAIVAFGKYKGERLSDVPDGYVQWGAENLSEGPWRSVFRAECERRQCGTPEGHAPCDDDRRSEAKRKIDAAAAQLTADQIEAIHVGLGTLAKNCDGAMAVDGTGFSKMDSDLGKSLAGKPRLTPRQAALGQRLIRKYQRQLDGALVARAVA